MPRPAPLASPDAIVPELEIVEAATALDDFLALPPTVRRDILAARREAGL